MSKSLIKTLQILVTIALLAIVFNQVGLFSNTGRQVFVRILNNADLALLALAVLLGVITNMSSALKWFMLTQSQNLGAGYWRIFSYYLIGQFYNSFLPTSVGGDMVRSYELGKFSGRQSDALASVFVERYTGVLVLLLISGIAVISQLSVFSVDFVVISLVAFAAVLGFIAWMLFDHRLYQTVQSALKSSLPITKSLFDKIDKLLQSIDCYKENHSALIWAFINSFVFYFLAVINVYITALVFQAEVNLMDVLIATPIIMLIMNIPLSFGNIGLMEFAYTNVFQLMGYSPALGLSIAVLMRLKHLFDSAMGGVLHPIFVTKKHE